MKKLGLRRKGFSSRVGIWNPVSSSNRTKASAWLRSSLLAALLITALVAAQDRADLQERIEFQVATVHENAGQRTVLSEARISGPPDTDFDILLQGSRLEMTARFLTDLRPDGDLLVRTRLQTRRLYGMSERGLPLYEEDSQREALQMSFEEQIVLLPFGRGGDERLLIEITPWRTQRPAGPLTIDILKASPGGQVSIQAHRVPHDYRLQASLIRKGEALATSAQRLLIEEEESVRLQPNRSDADPAVELKLTIDRYHRGGAGRVAFRFDVLQRGSPLALNWAGVTELGSSAQYPIKVDGQDCLLDLRFEPVNHE